jgi:hypothetical protein
MKCVCGHELIWGGDHSEDESDWLFETNYHCPKCQRVVMVYHPHEEVSSDDQAR